MNVTMRPLSGDLDWGWINAALPIMQVEDTSRIVAIADNKPVGALILDNWTENSVQGHFYIKDVMVLKYGFLEYCCDYVFNERGRKALYALVPSDNEKALRLDEHMGFTEKCRFDEAFAPGVDYVIMELKRENCVYLKEAA